MSDTSPPPRLSRETRKLVLKSLDQQLTDQEVQELQLVLRSDQQARIYYLHSVQMHVDLEVRGKSNVALKNAMDEYPTSEARDDTEASTEIDTLEKGSEYLAASGFVFRMRQYFATASYAASALLIAMGIGCGVGVVAAAIIYGQQEFQSIPWNAPLPDDVIARVVSTHDAQLFQNEFTPETSPTRGLRKGQQIRIREGLIEISYRSGATIVLEGPSVFEVRSSISGKLYSGKLMVTAPRASEGFAVEAASVIAEIQSGQVCVTKDESIGVMVSSRYGKTQAKTLDATSSIVMVSAGETARLDHTGRWQLFPSKELQFLTNLELPIQIAKTFAGEIIPLSNLFDDSIDTSLTEAVNSDQFQAAAETIDLGIAAVRDGGLDVDFYLAEGGVQFNLANVGGGSPRSNGLPGNDTFRSIDDIGLRTLGIIEPFSPLNSGKKYEDGIGISSNEMMTFDLDEIRSAGCLERQIMRFVVDRAGINDFHNQLDRHVGIGSARLVVIVSTEDEVISGYVNGQELMIEQNAGVHSFKFGDGKLGAVLRRFSEKISFDVPVPRSARYLTLASVMGEDVADDHGVFSGARLVLESREPDEAGNLD